MKRTGFRKKTYQEIADLKVKKMDKFKLKKKLPSIKTIRNKADALLTPIIKKLHPYCLLCAGFTEVAHHHVHKSASTRLRYELDNLIPLCTKCHFKLHQNESFWASKIVEYRGMEWFQRIDRLGRELVKADVHFYIENHKRLSVIINQE